MPPEGSVQTCSGPRIASNSGPSAGARTQSLFESSPWFLGGYTRQSQDDGGGVAGEHRSVHVHPQHLAIAGYQAADLTCRYPNTPLREHLAERERRVRRGFDVHDARDIVGVE